MTRFTQPDPSELTFTPVIANDYGWCGKCRSVDPGKDSFTIRDRNGGFVFRHVSCLERASCGSMRAHAGCEHGVDARALHRDVADTFGQGSATLEEVAKSLARILPNREIDDNDPAEREIVRTFDSWKTDVMVSVGRIHGWCGSCGTDGWCVPVVAFRVHGSEHRLMYHKKCLLKLCGAGDRENETDPLPIDRIRAALIREVDSPSRPWPAAHPSERAVWELVEPLFPGRFADPSAIAEQPACATIEADAPSSQSSDPMSRALQIALTGIADMSAAPSGRAGDQQRGAACMGALSQLWNELAAVTTQASEPVNAVPSRPPAPPDPVEVFGRLARRLDAVDRRLATLQSFANDPTRTADAERVNPLDVTRRSSP